MSFGESPSSVIARAPDAGGPAPDVSAGSAPPQTGELFDLTDYFSGSVAGTGLFQDRFGKVRLAFDVVMSGRWAGDTYRLTEDFTYDDGRTQQRVWHVRRAGGGAYTATADDIVGEATGSAAANETRWRYRMRVPVGNRLITMSFDDRMYLRPDGVLLNISAARKFGLLLGRLTAVFHKR